MKRSSKSKRISWAPRFNLCQVQLFSSEDCPSEVGHKLQDNFQVKTPWMLQSSNSTTDSCDVPPGFEGNKCQNKLKEEIPKIPQIRWKCPPKFIPNSNWFVAASEESEEKDAQKLREVRVLEAVYPRHASIPSSPCVSMDVEKAQYDDSVTPIIPMIPIEEEESIDVKSDVEEKVKYPVTMEPEFLPCQIPETVIPINTITDILPVSNGVYNGRSGISSNQSSDRVAAASAVLASIMKFSKQGSTIDADILFKILTDPKMSERLIKEHARIATAKNTLPNSTFCQPTISLNPANPSVPLSRSANEITKDVTIDMVGIPSSIPMSRAATPAIPISKPTLDMNRAVNQNTGVTTSDTNRLMNQNTGRLSTLSSYPAIMAVRSSLARPDSNGPMNQDMHQNPHVFNVKRVPSSSHSVVPGTKRVASTAFPNAFPEPNTVITSAGDRNMDSVGNQLRPVMSSLPNLPKTASISSALTDSSSQTDMNYYKNLIKEHGMEKHEIMKQQIRKPQSDIRYVKLVNRPKCQKPCIYFASSKGCRNGSNCQYMHGTNVHLESSEAIGIHDGKRLRLNFMK